MTIGTAIFACFISAWLTFMLTMLIDNEKDRRHAEKERRKSIRRDFERKMYNLEVYGNIYGNEVNCHGTRKNL